MFAVSLGNDRVFKVVNELLEKYIFFFKLLSATGFEVFSKI